jgi:4a-hydroxytetrahydrobiopterin dehydratase
VRVLPHCSFQASARLVDAIGGIDGIDEHPPRLDARHDGDTVSFLTKRAAGYRLTKADLELARAVERVATGQGLTADPTAIQCLLVISGALDRSAIMPFWQAILGYEPRVDSPDEDLVDPHDRDAAFWFEQMDEPRADGKGAIHIVVSVPYEQAQARIDATLAAGGRIVYDANARSGGRSRIQRAIWRTSRRADSGAPRLLFRFPARSLLGALSSWPTAGERRGD